MLLALAKILDLEESFALHWRLEERMTGRRLPGLIERLAGTVRRRRGPHAEELGARISAAAQVVSTDETGEALAALQALSPQVQSSGHPEAALVALILQGTGTIRQPHHALLILLALATRKVLLTRSR